MMKPEYMIAGFAKDARFTDAAPFKLQNLIDRKGDVAFILGLDHEETDADRNSLNTSTTAGHPPPPGRANDTGHSNSTQSAAGANDVDTCSEFEGTKSTNENVPEKSILPAI